MWSLPSLTASSAARVLVLRTSAVAKVYPVTASRQGLTLVHFSTQHKRFLWDRGASRSCLGGVSKVSGDMRSIRGCSGCSLCQKWLKLS